MSTNHSRVRAFAFCGVVLAGCASSLGPRSPAPDFTRLDPNAEPAAPIDFQGGPLALDTEYYLGSSAEEDASFDRFMKIMNERQRTLAREHGAVIQRGFHAKEHACLDGSLVLDRNRPAATRFGIFADGQDTKKVIVRFSNGVGIRQPDAELDARGMAVKVLGVPGPKYQSDELDTQDILLTNAPVPVGRDATEFMKFAQADTAGRLPSLLFLIGHAPTAAGALSRTNAIASLATERFWSGGAFHLGAHQAVKLATRPCDLRLVRAPDRSDPDYLKKDLFAAAKEGICMKLYVQIQSDPEKTPVEDASKEWLESDAPLLPVAQIVMPPQTLSESGAAACNALEFTPWHAIPAHKPMGHINRARRFVYAASAALRNAEPRR